MILHAAVLSDARFLNLGANDVPQVIQPIKDMLADRRNSVVERGESGVNEFDADVHLLTLSFLSLFIFGTRIKRPYGVSEAHTGYLLLQRMSHSFQPFL